MSQSLHNSVGYHFPVEDAVDIGSIYVSLLSAVLFFGRALHIRIPDMHRRHCILVQSADTHMDLISLDCRPGQVFQSTLQLSEVSFHTGAGFFSRKNSVHRKKAHSLDGTAVFNAKRIGKRLPEHLISAADAENHGALRSRLQDSRLQTVLSHPEKVFHGIFGAGKNDHIGIFQLRHPIHIPKRDTLHLFKWIEVCEI